MANLSFFQFSVGAMCHFFFFIDIYATLIYCQGVKYNVAVQKLTLSFGLFENGFLSSSNGCDIGLWPIDEWTLFLQWMHIHV
jgi:hypothetical protein